MSETEPMTDQTEIAEQIGLGKVPAEPVVKPRTEPKPADAHGWWWGTGRRKRAVARVRIRPSKEGKGGFKVQKTAKKFKTIEEYFTEDRDRIDCFAPLKLTDTLDKLDVFVRAHGGGTMGQAQAIRLGVARALKEYAAGRLPGAQHLCKGILERDIETTVPDCNAEIVLYCGGGYRSALAAVNLQKMGYTSVSSLAGGWRSWLEAGFPTEKHPGKPLS